MIKSQITRACAPL